MIQLSWDRGRRLQRLQAFPGWFYCPRCWYDFWQSCLWSSHWEHCQLYKLLRWEAGLGSPKRTLLDSHAYNPQFWWRRDLLLPSACSRRWLQAWWIQSRRTGTESCSHNREKLSAVARCHMVELRSEPAQQFLIEQHREEVFHSRTNLQVDSPRHALWGSKLALSFGLAHLFCY